MQTHNYLDLIACLYMDYYSIKGLDYNGFIYIIRSNFCDNVLHFPMSWVQVPLTSRPDLLSLQPHSSCREQHFKGPQGTWFSSGLWHGSRRGFCLPPPPMSFLHAEMGSYLLHFEAADSSEPFQLQKRAPGGGGGWSFSPSCHSSGLNWVPADF